MKTAKQIKARIANEKFKLKFNDMSRRDKRISIRHLVKQKRGEEFVKWLKDGCVVI